MKILPISIEKSKEQNGTFFIELYNIYLKTGTIHICNCDTVITFNNRDYQPVPIERGSIKSTVDAKIDNMDLKIADADNSKISALMSGFDFRGRVVEIIRIQYPDSLEDNSIFVPVFYGYLDTPSYSNGEFSCIVKANFPKVKVPAWTTQYYCNNTFGDSGCKMDKAERNLKIDPLTSTPTELVIVDELLTADFYKNGLVTNGYETKMIKSNTENKIITFYPFLSDLKSEIRVVRNCDKTPEMCEHYKNRKNYGGFLAIPKEFRLGT